MSVVKLENVTKVYGFGEAATVALDDVSLEVDKGEFVAIMGPSGSGKSTLMNVIGLLDHPTQGTYHMLGQNTDNYSQRKAARIRRDKIGFIFQSFNLLPRLSAIENVSLPLLYRAIGRIARLRKAEAMLKKVHLEDRQYYMPTQLSGGQVQRVAIARALINRPSIVLADEPTGNLDTQNSTDIMKLLTDINDGGNTIIMITHNPELAKYAKRIINMQDGKIVSDKPTSSSKKSKKKSKSKKDKDDKEKDDV